MKKKFFSIFFALVLVLSFSLVMAVPVGANGVTWHVYDNDVELVIEANGMATWVTTPANTGDHSAKLGIPTSYTVDDVARVTAPYSGNLNSITSLSYYYNVDASTPLTLSVYDGFIKGNACVEPTGGGYADDAYGVAYLTIALDADANGGADTWVIQTQWASTSNVGWQLDTIDLGVSPFHVVTILSGYTSSPSFPLGTDWGSLTEIKDASLTHASLDPIPLGTATVLQIKINVGDWNPGGPTPPDDPVTTFIDSLEINGATLDLEPGVIQEAIDSATEHDTIIVAAGTYDESVSISTNNLIVKAQNRAVTEGAAENAIVSPASGNGFTVNADEVTIDGFEIADITGSGIWFVGSNNIFQWNLVHDVTAGEFAAAWRFGAIASYVSNAFVQGYEGKEYVDYNQILNNTIYNCNGPGISYASGDTVGAVDINVGAVISGNTIYDVCSALYNGLQYNYAIFIMNGRGFTISENNITDFASLDISCQDGDAPDYQHGDHQILDNKKMGHIRIWASGPWAKCDNLTITGNEIFDAARPGLRLGVRNQLSISESVFSENHIHNNEIGILMGKKVHDNVIADNTIEDNGLGIKVEGDNNQITGNDILSNDEGAEVPHYGIYLTNDASGNTIHFNNIVGNSAVPGNYGVKNENTGENVDATNNWWGNASGPIPPGTYDSYGDEVSGNVNFEPWLLAEVNIAEVAIGTFPTTYHKTLALKDGWTLISVDKAVAEPIWIGTNPLLAEDLPEETIYALEYTPTGGFVSEVTTADLEPLTAIYVLTDGGGGVGFKYAEDGDPAFYSKELEAGWNLISIPDMEVDIYDILSPLRYVTIGTQQGIGLTTLVSQEDYSQFSDFFYQATLTDEDWDDLPELKLFDGYWANMEAAETFEVPVL